MDKQTMPSHYKIFDYWKDKTITPTLEVVSYTDHPDVKGIDVVKDWGEPECWCCGKFVHQIYNYKSYEQNLQIDGGLKNIWEYKEVKSALNRCHITSKQLQGGNEPHNLFLMCESCHIQSPDTINPQIFLAWVVAKRKRSFFNGFPILEIFDEVNGICKTMNINFADVIVFLTQNTSILQKTTSEIGTHGGKISVSSYAGAIVHMYINHKQKEKQNEKILTYI